MRLAVIIVIAVAALFAGGVFYFLLQYMEGVERDAFELAEQSKPGVAAVEVLVADIDLPAGTIIDSTILDWQAWPDDSLGDGYVAYREEDDDTDKSDLEEEYYDKIVRRTILAGEPITDAKLFTQEGASFLSGMLEPGMRAVAIRVQDVSGVGGFIMPGDRVDVIVSMKWKIDTEAKKAGAPFTEYTSETIVQNARVMGIDQAFNDFEENVAKASAVTIEVTPKQAEIIAISANRGELSLALRSQIPGPIGVIEGFTSDRESLYSMGGGFPAADRLAQPVVVADKGGDGAAGVKPLPGIQVFRAMAARRDLPKGTLLRESDVGWAVLSPGLRPEDYVIQGREAVLPSFFTGVLLNTDVKAGEPLPFADLYAATNAEFLGLALREGMRAIKVEVRKDTFAGTPGDEVDVVLVAVLDDDQQFSETIVQKVRVLSLDAGEKGAFIEVTPRQFETVALAHTMGILRLSLRSSNTVLTDYYAGPFTSSIEVSRALGGVIDAETAALAAQAAAAQAAADQAASTARTQLSAAELAAASAASAEAAATAAAQAAVTAAQRPVVVVGPGPAPASAAVAVEGEESTIRIYRSTSSTTRSFSESE